jgi:broad specificity phosphatase PhoE
MLDRRQLLGAASLLVAPVWSAQREAPGSVLILRHAATEPGIGDPPGYRLDHCPSQRNLSAEGRRQAHAIGQRLAAHGWRPSALLTSQWCRCRDSASGIATGLGPPVLGVTAFEALNSFFEERSREPAQTAILRQRLGTLAGVRGFEIWVTHQVNIMALTDRVLAMGEGLWLTPGEQGKAQLKPFPA